MQGYCPCPSPNDFLYATTNRTPCQTREPRSPSPSGGNFTAKPHVSRSPCAPMARSPGCRGATSARPASRETLRRAAATSRPSRMSPEHPARLWRAARGAGVLPLLLPLPETFGVVVFKLAVGGFGKTKGKPFVEQKMEAGEGFRTGKHLAAKIGPGFG